MNIDRIQNAQLGLELTGTGQRRKTRALTEAEEKKAAAIGWLRKELGRLYQSRVRALPSYPEMWNVSADDARRLYDDSKFPQAYARSRAWFGSIFRGSDWQKVGWTKSKHPSNNGRDIKTWRYVG